MPKKIKQQKKTTKNEEENEISKDTRAADYLGIRGEGQPLFGPHEIGYVCPICDKGDEVNLHFSEYNGFLWCKNCNIDIPSCLCVKNGTYENCDKELPKHEQIEHAIEVFFATADDIIEKYKKDQQTGKKDEKPRKEDNRISKKTKTKRKKQN